MKSANPWKRIFDTIGEAAALEMVAEEAAELSATAAKLARIVRGENPTRVDWDMGYRWLVEEIADVRNALNVFYEGLPGHDRSHYEGEIDDWMQTKMTRWYRHLFKEEEPNE